MEYTENQFKKELIRLKKLEEKEGHLSGIELGKLIAYENVENLILFGVSRTFKEKIEKDIERLEKEKVEFKKNWLTIDGEIGHLQYYLTATNTEIRALKTALNYC